MALDLPLLYRSIVCTSDSYCCVYMYTMYTLYDIDYTVYYILHTIHYVLSTITLWQLPGGGRRGVYDRDGGIVHSTWRIVHGM